MKTFDIVKTPGGGIGIVTETNENGTSASIEYIDSLNTGDEHNAWWEDGELKIIDSVIRIIASAMCHPFGNGEDDVDKFFKIAK